MPGRYIAAGLYSEVIVNRGSTVQYNVSFNYVIVIIMTSISNNMCTDVMYNVYRLLIISLIATKVQ